MAIVSIKQSVLGGWNNKAHRTCSYPFNTANLKFKWLREDLAAIKGFW